MLAKPEDAFIIKPDGRRLGPYKAKFAGSTVIINDQLADVADGDQVVRILPNQNEELKLVKECFFYGTGIGGQGPHFQLKVKPISSSESYIVKNQTINVGSNSSVQIGDHNRMEFRDNIQNMINTIEKSSASDAEKNEAKGLLKKFLEHPLVTTIAGAAAGTFLS
ncbi:MAG: hypothetical protein E6Z83_00095 [Pantoea sp.]|uniref:hypothetical protein n=1 Tax=Pantoea sp. TaxID=69393 RepID=UPI00290A9E71|nr:hypothetical protein [Pantoea sp.]MDU5779186.1 hypothetical protein [Pantoea sp.]